MPKKNKSKLLLNKFLTVTNLSYVLVLLALALFLTATLDIGQSSFWRDEAFTIKLIRHGFFDVIKIMAGDFAPFLHPMVAWIVSRLFGFSEISLRGLSWVMVIFTIPYLRKLFKQDIHKNIATAIFLSSYLTYYYAVEARYYSMFTFLVMAGFYYTLNFFKAKRAWNKILFVIFNISLLYLHTISTFVYATYSLIIFIEMWRCKKFNLKNIIYMILPGIFYIPWFLVLLKQLGSLKDNPFWLQFDPWFSLRDNIQAFFFWPKFHGPEVIYDLSILLKVIIYGMMILSVIGILVSLKNKKYQHVLAGLMPLALVYLLSFKQPLFYIRYLAFAYPFIVYYLVTALKAIKVKQLALFVGFVLVVFYVDVYATYYRGYRKPHYRQVGEYITANYNLSQYKVVNDTEYSYFPCEYYIGNCFIAKEYSQIANVGKVLLNDQIALDQERLLALDKIVLISWNPDIIKDRPELAEFKQNSQTQIDNFYIYSFEK